MICGSPACLRKNHWLQVKKEKKKRYLLGPMSKSKEWSEGKIEEVNNK
jgi:hypothetical protein